ncbi:MAG TPA: hypothetical protein VNF47_11885 [Streptosporangiaceae bacterium]|nr:hypothetical protein [Streptosporangiaceae bacterium]
MAVDRYLTRGMTAFAFIMMVTACAASSPPTASPSAGLSPASGSPSPGSASTGSAAPTTGGTAPTSCTVITAAEASAALGGQPVTGPRRGNAYVEGGVACVYYGPSAPAQVSPNIPIGDTVRVVLVTGPNAKKWFGDYRGKVRARPISGIGDQAYYDGYASISVLKGDAYLRIAVGIADNLSAEETLARAALPRM